MKITAEAHARIYADENKCSFLLRDKVQCQGFKKMQSAEMRSSIQEGVCVFS